MNILNPKVALFFLAFLPQFVNTGAGSVPMQMVFLGIVFLVQAWLIFSVISVFAGTIGDKIVQRSGIGKYINWGNVIFRPLCYGLIALMVISEKR